MSGLEVWVVSCSCRWGLDQQGPCTPLQAGMLSESARKRPWPQCIEWWMIDEWCMCSLCFLSVFAAIMLVLEYVDFRNSRLRPQLTWRNRMSTHQQLIEIAVSVSCYLASSWGHKFFAAFLDYAQWAETILYLCSTWQIVTNIVIINIIAIVIFILFLNDASSQELIALWHSYSHSLRVPK